MWVENHISANSMILDYFVAISNEVIRDLRHSLLGRIGCFDQEILMLGASTKQLGNWLW